VTPFGLTHLLTYQSKGWGVGGGARKALLQAMMANFLNFKEESREKLNTYAWTTVFSAEVLTLVDDGYMKIFTLIASLGKIMLLILFMAYLASRHYRETGEFELFVSIIPLFFIPPMIYCYLAIRAKGTEDLRQDLVAASVNLRQFTGECVSHYRLIADYWSRPIALAETTRLTQQFNSKVTARSKRQANDEAFFGWIIKAVEFGTISGLGALVINGHMKIGTFVAILNGLRNGAKEFRGAYLTMMSMQACLPCMWKCVEYLNLPHNLWDRKTKLTEVRRWFADNTHAEMLRDPGGIPEDRVPIFVQNIRFTYAQGEPHIIRDLTATINQGELVALIGPHNSGKNTLLQILSGIILPNSGSVQVPPHLRVLHVKYVEQIWDRPLTDTLYYGWMAANGVARFEDLDGHTIEKGLRLCKELHVHEGLLNMIERETRARAKGTEGTMKVSITEAAQARRTGLTSDSRNKLQLACALLAHPEVLIIHKPVTHANWKDGARIMALLRRYVDHRGMGEPSDQVRARRPCTCIVSMEKPLFLEHVHRTLELNDGQLDEVDPQSTTRASILEIVTDKGQGHCPES
jgi:energy-coupling factor transporter ATP-binding protein EcfA2